MPAFISLSGTGSCGGNDFWCPRFKEDGLSAEKSGGHPIEKTRYALDSKILSKPLKVHSYSRYIVILTIMLIALAADALPLAKKNRFYCFAYW